MGREWFSFKSIDEMQLAILLLFVFFYVLAVTITTNDQELVHGGVNCTGT